jgi:hypothetical protein
VELGIDGFNLTETFQSSFSTASRFIKNGRAMDDIKKSLFDQQIQMGIDGTKIHIHLVDDPGFVCAGSLAGRKDIGKDLIFASSRHLIKSVSKACIKSSDHGNSKLA